LIKSDSKDIYKVTKDNKNILNSIIFNKKNITSHLIITNN